VDALLKIAGSADRLLDVAQDMRRRLIRIGIAMIVLSAACFPQTETILRWFQERTTAPLAAFGIADAFLALITVALGVGAAAVLPHAAWEFLAAVAGVYPGLTRRVRGLFWSLSMLLFYAGMGFCIQVTLPYGSRFLLGYGSAELQPVICVRQFTDFCLVLSIGFGLLFELPLLMTLLAWLKVATAARVAGWRRYAVVLIIIAAAVVTPTPDIVNLLLLAVPLYLLFEMGLLGMLICERRRQALTVSGASPRSL
jgi:sec-independent protein translocase protein TatC